jgi:hypothetical protein
MDTHKCPEFPYFFTEAWMEPRLSSLERTFTPSMASVQVGMDGSMAVKFMGEFVLAGRAPPALTPGWMYKPKGS